MHHFEYTAQCEGGTALSGTIEAADSEAAMQQLRAMQLGNIELQPAGKPAPRRPLGGDDFIFFNEQLASLASAGIALDAGLRQLAKDVESRPLRRTINEIAGEVEAGQSLDKAMEKHAGQMPALYGRVVRAGIESGQLPGTLLNLSHHLRLMADTRRLIRDTLAYPIIVLILALGIFCTFVMLVVPRFASIFQDFDTELPGLTRGLISLSHHLPAVLLTTGVIVVLLIIALTATRVSPAWQLFRERIFLGIPLAGRLVRDSIRARFLRASAFLVGGGVPLPRAVRLAADATGSPNASKEAERVGNQLEQGAGAFEACQNATLIPPMFGYVVQISSDRDNLGNALAQLAGTYDARAIHNQSIIRGWLAPIAIVIVGAVIATCIVGLFLPLVHLIESVS